METELHKMLREAGLSEELISSIVAKVDKEVKDRTEMFESVLDGWKKTVAERLDELLGFVQDETVFPASTNAGCSCVPSPVDKVEPSMRVGMEFEIAGIPYCIIELCKEPNTGFVELQVIPTCEKFAIPVTLLKRCLELEDATGSSEKTGLTEDEKTEVRHKVSSARWGLHDIVNNDCGQSKLYRALLADPSVHTPVIPEVKIILNAIGSDLNDVLEILQEEYNGVSLSEVSNHG